MILSRIVFPATEDACALYYHGRAGTITEKSIELLLGERLRFDTYFNAFFYGPYAIYTDVKQVRTVVVTTGEIHIRLIALNRDNCEIPLMDIEVHGTGIRTELPVCPLSALPVGGALFLEMTAQSAPAYVHSVWYESNVACQRVKLAIVICTYHREQYVRQNLRNLQEKVLEDPDCPAGEEIDIFVVDNGKTLQFEQSPHIFMFPNKNCGGSGGFTRGMLEAYSSKDRYTHVLLMDDDISFEPETIVRTVQFLKAAKTSERPLCVGGQMLLENSPTIQFEAGSSYINGRLVSNGQGLDLSDRKALLENGQNAPVQYNAWWYSCLPVSAIKKWGLPLPLFIKTDDVEYGLRLEEQVVLLNGIGVWHREFSSKYSPYLEYYIKRNELIVSAIHGSGAGTLHSLGKLLRTYGRACLTGEARIIFFESRACLDFLKGPDFLLETDGETLHRNLVTAGKSRFYFLKESFCLIFQLLRLVVRYPAVRRAYQERWRELTTERFWRRYLDLEGENIP